MIRVLVVEDDQGLNRSICSFLEQNGYSATGCANVPEAYDVLYKQPHDLIVSDIMMPRIDGFEFVRRVRAENPDIPMLLLTARDDLSSKERGFHNGVDDYLVKPVDLPELLWHIEALLRRAHIAADKRLQVGDVLLDAEEYAAYLGGEQVSLSVREFDILYRLLSYPKKTFTRSQLMNEFWEAGASGGTRTVDVYMARIRSKFSATDAFEIQTVYGMGYKAVLK